MTSNIAAEEEQVVHTAADVSSAFMRFWSADNDTADNPHRDMVWTGSHNNDSLSCLLSALCLHLCSRRRAGCLLELMFRCDRWQPPRASRATVLLGGLLPWKSRADSAGERQKDN